jgi:tRNA modification GTPase
VVNVLKTLVEQYQSSHLIRDGIKVLIVGRPNVGKSSLMNRLLKKERAIVTPIPGTTRDFLEETINIKGLPACIIDTAGFQETENPVELIGIAKTQEYIEIADLIMFLIEAHHPLTVEDQRIYDQIQHKPFIVVLNKSDLITDDRCVSTPDSWQPVPEIKTSALYGQGFDQLQNEIVQIVLGENPLYTGDTVVPNLRQKIALENALVAVQKAMVSLKAETEPELASIDIQDAIEALGEISGLNVKPDVLSEIFSQFCIGK